MHLTSLPGPYFNGDLGDEAKAFIDFLQASGQSWWQMLPVNPIGPGFSPYSTISSFAGEPLFISLVDLVRRGLLSSTDIKAPPLGRKDRVNYKKAEAFRYPLLRKAFAKAKAKPGFFDSAAYKKFKKTHGGHKGWLGDFTLFGAIASKQGTTDWREWPEALRRRNPKALADISKELSQERQYLEFTQFLFFEQWENLKKYAASRGIGLIGDLPIFVGFKSADVWSNPKFFLLDKKLTPRYVAGVPPDSFNANGQLWGNALYDWAALQKDQFSWWMRRMGQCLQMFDVVRLDHFIGFYRYWRIPATAKTARTGVWHLAKGDSFFFAVKKAFPAMPFIAEDLGAVTSSVRALRDRFGLPGMKVLQFGFDGSDEATQHQPHHFAPQSVVYTGTHDNQTIKGWIADLKKRRGKSAAKELAEVRAYNGVADSDICLAMVRVGMQSPSNLCVTPVQDLLELGAKHRMNIPGTAQGNWRWRLPEKRLTPKLAAEFKSLTTATRRS
jgi:4-alpha-glucanotransferase